jgi:nucleoside-diphosphate-sugar epimerase
LPIELPPREYTYMKNLVIGSDGFIGKPFCSYLESLGEEVIRFDLKQNKKQDARVSSLPLGKVDRVYFLAWDVGGSKYLYQEKTQLSQLTWNVELLQNVMSQLEKKKVQFMFASSQLVEENTIYGVTKKLGELWTEQLGGVSIRIWNAYGYMEADDVKSHVISDFIHQALSNKKIKMITDGEEWRQFTHIDDLARAFHQSLTLEKRTRTVYDASSYRWVQVKEIAEMIAEVTGADIEFGTKKGTTLTASNMGRLPGWLPKIELEEGVKRMIKEYKKQLQKDEVK